MEVVMLVLSVQALFGPVRSPYHEYGLYVGRYISSKGIIAGGAAYRQDDPMREAWGGE
jgi:hypothetical protein